MTTSNAPWIRDAVAEILGEEPAAIADDESLFEAGLDSVALLRLVNRLRRGGLQISFTDLAREPTLAAWDRLAGKEKIAAAEPLASPGAFSGKVEPGFPKENATNQRSIPAVDAARQADDGLSPLGAMQHAYWAGRSAGQRLGGVAAHLYAEFDHAPTGAEPAIDPDRLKCALERLLERHETLRTRITANGKQEVLPKLSAPFILHDSRGHSPAAIKEHLAKIRDAFSHQALDIESGEVLSVALTLLPDGATRLHLDVDMIAADAVSYRILLADFAALYAAPATNLPPLQLNYRDYLASPQAGQEQRRHLAREAWQARLPLLPGAPVLPERIEAAPESPTPRVARRHFRLPLEQKQRLSATARQNGVTVAMTLAAVLAEIIGHWSATDHFLLNVPMFNRAADHADIDRIVGDFSSSVMLEIDLRQPLAFADRVRALQDRMHVDAAHAAYSGLDVLRDLSRQRGETVLAPVVFTSALGLGELFSPEVTAVVGRPAWVISQGPQVLLDAQVTEFENGLLVNWDSREEALIPGVVDAMFKAFEQGLQALIDAPEAWARPMQVSTANPPPRRLGHRAVRIVDSFGRDRPDHVTGRILFAGEERQDSQCFGRADENGQVTLLGDEHERINVHAIAVWPAEVEEAIRSDRRISDAAVLRHGESLVAAVVFERLQDGETPPGGKAFRAQLARQIPSRLLPSRIIVLDRLPRDAGGKPDFEAMRQLVAAHFASAGPVAPRSDLERVIAGLWEEILGLETIGVHEEFIALGGDSLLAARLVSRLQEELDTNAVTLRALFRSPTVAELAEQLRKDDDPHRLDEIAAIVLEIRAMSDEEVAARLGETAPGPAAPQSGTAGGTTA